MKTAKWEAMENYLYEQNKKIEEDPDYAIGFFNRFLFSLVDDVDDLQNVVEHMKKNDKLPAYIKHRIDSFKLTLNGIETSVASITEILKKAEQDENKNKEETNDNNSEKCIRDEQLVNPCGSDPAERRLREAEG